MDERYQHIKRGTTYEVIARGKLQTDTPLSDYAELVAYRCEETGDVWFRPQSEFTPDRFRAIPAALSPEPAPAAPATEPVAEEPAASDYRAVFEPYPGAFNHIIGAQEPTDAADLRAEVARLREEINKHKSSRDTTDRKSRRNRARAEKAEAEVKRLREAPTKAASDVLAERARQLRVEGWTPEHDDNHTGGEMAMAAATYACATTFSDEDREHIEPEFWPWDRAWLKLTDRRRDLVKAGALILAEIERMDRAALGEPRHG